MRPPVHCRSFSEAWAACSPWLLGVVSWLGGGGGCLGRRQPLQGQTLHLKSPTFTLPPAASHWSVLSEGVDLSHFSIGSPHYSPARQDWHLLLAPASLAAHYESGRDLFFPLPFFYAASSLPCRSLASFLRDCSLSLWPQCGREGSPGCHSLSGTTWPGDVLLPRNVFFHIHERERALLGACTSMILPLPCCP